MVLCHDDNGQGIWCEADPRKLAHKMSLVTKLSNHGKKRARVKPTVRRKPCMPHKRGDKRPARVNSTPRKGLPSKRKSVRPIITSTPKELFR